MVWTALGDAFPLAIAIGLSPFAVITAVVLSMGDNGRAKASMFALGWFLTIALMTAIAVVFAEAAVDADAETYDDGRDLVNLVLGLALFVLAWRSWQKRPADGEPTGMAKMIDRIAGIGPLGALGFGLLQGVVVVKNIPLALSGGARLGEAGLDSGAVTLGVIGFAMIGSIGMIVLIVGSVIGGERFDQPLAALRQWMESNMTSIKITVLVLIGALLFGRGLAILG